MSVVWTFKTKRLRVEPELEEFEPYAYRYDGDDSDGEIQAMLNSGEMVAFDSRVAVWLDGRIIGEDHLGGSVYYAATVAEFWTAHRDRDPMSRNCSIYRDTMRAPPWVTTKRSLSMFEVTNADRAAWANEAIDAFRNSHRSDGDLQTDIKDLITDLLHLARRECGVEDAVHFATLAANMHDMEVIEDTEE